MSTNTWPLCDKCYRINGRFYEILRKDVTQKKKDGERKGQKDGESEREREGGE